MLENVYENGPEELLPLFENLAPQGVGFCLDTGHQAAFGRAPLAAWLDILGRHLGRHHNRRLVVWRDCLVAICARTAAR